MSRLYDELSTVPVRRSVLQGFNGTDDFNIVQVTSDGCIKVLETGKDFRIHNEDTGSDTKYYGYEERNGVWFIMKEVTSTQTYTYTMGTSGYATGWTNRASHSYDTWGTVF